MLLIITFFVILTAITVKYNLFNVYIIPYAIVTILIRTFIDSRTALFASIVTILLSSLMVPYPFEFIEMCIRDRSWKRWQPIYNPSIEGAFLF